MPREWDSPVREKWNAPIHNILKAVDNHVSIYLKSGDRWHIEQANFLRQYVKELKDRIKQEEDW